MMRDTFRIDVDVPQQNRQRAPRHGPETDEQDSMRKRLHRIASVLPW